MSPTRMLRRSDLRALLVAGVAAALASVALGLTIIVRTNQGEEFRRQTSTNCQAVEKLKARIRDTFQDGKERAEHNLALDPVQRAAVLAYYDRELERYAADDCPSP